MIGICFLVSSLQVLFLNNILGWSLAVSNIIDVENNVGLIAISCITNEDMNPKLKICFGN
jgi:hypothetical protein